MDSLCSMWQNLSNAFRARGPGLYRDLNSEMFVNPLIDEGFSYRAAFEGQGSFTASDNMPYLQIFRSSLNADTSGLKFMVYSNILNVNLSSTRTDQGVYKSLLVLQSGASIEPFKGSYLLRYPFENCGILDLDYHNRYVGISWRQELKKRPFSQLSVVAGLENMAETDKLNLSFGAQITGGTATGSPEWKFKDFSCGAKLALNDLKLSLFGNENFSKFVAAFYLDMTRNLAVGYEVAFKRSDQIGQWGSTVLTVGGKLSLGENLIKAHVSTEGMAHVCWEVKMLPQFTASVRMSKRW